MLTLDVHAGTMPHNKLLHAQPGSTPALVLPPFKLPAHATPEQQNMALFTRRNHPLYRDVTFRLLAEVINSRLFRTVRPPQAGLQACCCHHLLWHQHP